MIRLIAAIDSKLGLANDKEIPWHLPTDSRYYREKTKATAVLMGYTTYTSYSKPLADRPNFVITSRDEKFREGFEAVHDLESFLSQFTQDLWILGGARVFEQTICLADELYLTRVDGDFGCTKFFPPFEKDFVLSEQSETKIENGISFWFEVWKTKLKKQG